LGERDQIFQGLGMCHGGAIRLSSN
jgi:hypothetical protein